MEALVATVVVVLLLVLYLGLGTWIFAGLMLVSMTGLILILDMPLSQLGAIMKGNMWRRASTWELASIPLFVWMGEMIFRTNISARMFRGLAPWVDRIPGRLLHTNILGCTLFAAVSGSSTATTATIGKITTVSLIERGYDERLAIGSIAGAGTLGLMIPPSIVMIVYGLLAEQSIARLFAAGLFPGLLVAALYSGYTFIRCVFEPERAPKEDRDYTWRDRLRGILDLAPILVLIPVVLGGIYTGLATPSEAAALGVAGTLIITTTLGQMSLASLCRFSHGDRQDHHHGDHHRGGGDLYVDRHGLSPCAARPGARDRSVEFGSRRAESSCCSSFTWSSACFSKASPLSS